MSKTELLKKKIERAIYEKGSFQGVWNGGDFSTTISLTEEEAATFSEAEEELTNDNVDFWYDDGELTIIYKD